VGDIVATVDGAALSAGANLEQALAYKIGKQVSLGVVPSTGGAPKEVRVRAIALGAEKNLYYRAWVEDDVRTWPRQRGKLGYAHMLDMGPARCSSSTWTSTPRTTRGTGGDRRAQQQRGFVNAYALDVLARRPYLTMQPRGGDVAPARSQLGQRALEKPTVLVTNQHSLSDAEDFTEGYRTSGWARWSASDGGLDHLHLGAGLVDGSTVRLPGTRIRDQRGKDMEMVPRKVDVAVRRGMGEWYAGVDTQLDAAVKVADGEVEGRGGVRGFGAGCGVERGGTRTGEGSSSFLTRPPHQTPPRPFTSANSVYISRLSKSPLNRSSGSSYGASSYQIRRGMGHRCSRRPCRITEFRHHHAGQPARDGAGQAQGLTSGSELRARFRADDSIEKASMETHELQFMYKSGRHVPLHETENYDQLEMDEETLGDNAP